MEAVCAKVRGREAACRVPRMPVLCMPYMPNMPPAPCPQMRLDPAHVKAGMAALWSIVERKYNKFTSRQLKLALAGHYSTLLPVMHTVATQQPGEGGYPAFQLLNSLLPTWSRMRNVTGGQL